MVSTFSAGSNFQSTNFQSMFENSNTNNEFTFVDFLPERLSSAGLFHPARYEKFRSTVDRANEWLCANPQWEIKSCESVKFEESRGVIKAERMIHAEQNDFSINFVRGLRLWISKRKADKHRSQQIGYLNMIPDLLKKGGAFSSPKSERLSDIIKRYNKMTQMKPIPGRIISIETPDIQMKSRNKVDPEISNWCEIKDGFKEYIFIIRVFFEVTESTETPPQEEIGVMDFLPNLLQKKGILTLPKYDNFSNTLHKITDCCSTLAGKRICNVQSVVVNLKKVRNTKCRCQRTRIDTKQTHYMENRSLMTFYVQILRVTYVKCPVTSKLDKDPICPITCKTFVPVQKSRSVFLPDFESLTETKARVSAWIKATDAQVICAETIAIRLNSVGERKDCSEASLTFNRSGWTEYWIFAIRIYMSGVYKEPPIEMLPPLPILEDENRCTII